MELPTASNHVIQVQNECINTKLTVDYASDKKIHALQDILSTTFSEIKLEEKLELKNL
jgi:hypothetical protein